MDIIGANLQAVRARIARAAADCGRAAAEIQLVAVSKTFGADAITAAHACSQRAFGENYVQEALEKMAALSGLPLEWHFIGPVQSNKTRPIAEHFDWVHSVDRLKIAERLSAARPTGRSPLQVCIEVNLSGEATKGGVALRDAPVLARAVHHLPGLKLRGLMAIPPAGDGIARQRGHFSQLRKLQEEIVTSGIMLDTLSIGMSDDLEAAIAEGATMVRVGTAIFGARAKPKIKETS
jgi:hypothetical protein